MNLTDAQLLLISNKLISKNSISENVIKNHVENNKKLFGIFNYEFNIEEVAYSLIKWASALMILETNCQVFTKTEMIRLNNNYGPLLLNKSMIYEPNKLLEWLQRPESFNLKLIKIEEGKIDAAISTGDVFCKEINSILEIDSNLSIDDYYKIWFILSFLYYSIFVNREMLTMMLAKLPGAIIDWAYNMQNDKTFKLKNNIGEDLDRIENNFNNVGFKTKYYEHNRCSTNVNGINIEVLFIEVNKINPRMYYHMPFKEINGVNHCCTRVNALYNLYLFGSIERNKQYITINNSANTVVNRKVNVF